MSLYNHIRSHMHKAINYHHHYQFIIHLTYLFIIHDRSNQSILLINLLLYYCFGVYSSHDQLTLLHACENNFTGYRSNIALNINYHLFFTKLFTIIHKITLLTDISTPFHSSNAFHIHSSNAFLLQTSSTQH